MADETDRPDSPEQVDASPENGGVSPDDTAAPREDPTEETVLHTPEGRHRYASRGQGFAELASDAPILLVSVVLHLAILGLLAFVVAREPQAIRKRLTLDVEEIEITEELTPPRKELNLYDKTTAAAAGSIAAAAESYKDAVKRVGKVRVARVDVTGLNEGVRAGTVREFDTDEGGELQYASSKDVEGIAGAVDQLAILTLNSVRRRPTLVVMVVDRSRSIIYERLPRVIRRMDHYFEEIRLNMPGAFAGNARWAVVSFGRREKVECKPTDNLERVKKALYNVKVDTSGQENIGRALQKVAQLYKAKGTRIIAVAITDEAGDDVYDGTVLEKTARALRDANASLCVFGFESVFCARNKFITFKLDPKVVRDVDRDAIRGFEGKTMHGWSIGGPESPRPELWWGKNWWIWHHWGGSFGNLASGFGMYSLNRLSLATKGIYFLLEEESKYNEDKLYGRYKPDLCSVRRYRARIKAAALKRELCETWAKMGEFYLPYLIYSPSVAQKSIARAKEGREFCTSKARKLAQLIERSRPRGDNWMRWVAHAELTRAELLRLCFMLGQYHAALGRFWHQAGGKIPKGQRIVVHRGKIPQDYVGGAAAKKEYDYAREAIQMVIDNHAETPWEVAARAMLRGLNPWRVSFDKVPEHVPQPPSLAF